MDGMVDSVPPVVVAGSVNALSRRNLGLGTGLLYGEALRLGMFPSITTPTNSYIAL